MTQFANIGALELNEMAAPIDDAVLEANGMLTGSQPRTNPFHICIDDAALEMVAEAAGPQPPHGPPVTVSVGAFRCH